MRVILNLLTVQHAPVAIMLKYMQTLQLANKALPSLVGSRLLSIQTKKESSLMGFIRVLELPKSVTSPCQGWKHIVCPDSQEARLGKHCVPEDDIQLQASARSLIDRQSPLCQSLQMSWAGESTCPSVR